MHAEIFCYALLRKTNVFFFDLFLHFVPEASPTLCVCDMAEYL